VLEDAHGAAHRGADLHGSGATLIAFVCNHCPYVQHIERAFGELVGQYRERGLSVIAVVSNDPVSYPQDGPDGMREQSVRARWDFPYLRDVEQTFAQALGAVCTPDLFLYGSDGRLAHRGGFDASSPRNAQSLTGADLRTALDAVLAGSHVPAGLAPALGCSIKWAEGRAPQ
jgi:hypothetical protein